ncbi:glycosyltransferase [Mesorhizobium sp. KR9-304]|uniref:glycosyltransferase family 2 protein n=1 Tax=Mesorhizobium sp. KR9-304 TaxID=3156614 RepID=UPI0032B38AA2
MHKDTRDIIAIPTFNRIRHLVACLRCLRQARGLERYRVFVRDDASSEFGADEIARLIPEATSIERNVVNLGPDANQLLLFRDCLEAGARRILVLDSDMLVSPSILEFTEQAFERTGGFLGLYNSLLHGKRRDMDCDLIEKWSVGGTATCWESGLMGRVIDRCERDLTQTWDWIANAELNETRTPIIVSRRSYAQHLGIMGVNNGVFGKIDYGLGFIIETDDQARFMAETFDDLMSRQRQVAASKRKTKLKAWYKPRFLEVLKRIRQRPDDA